MNGPGPGLAKLGVPPHRRQVRHDPATGWVTADTAFLPHHANLAASAQSKLEACLTAVVSHALNDTGSTNLCVAGGVGLNCTANGHLLRTLDLCEMFVQPAAGDAGCALGAALESVHRRHRIPGARYRRHLLFRYSPTWSKRANGAPG